MGIVLPWLALQSAAEHGASPDLQSALFLAWTLPLTAALGLALYAPGLLSGLTGRWRREIIPEPTMHPGLASRE
jgi:hypothetical protein